MEYIVKSHKGQLETHFIDPKTGVLKKVGGNVDFNLLFAFLIIDMK